MVLKIRTGFKQCQNKLFLFAIVVAHLMRPNPFNEISSRKAQEQLISRRRQTINSNRNFIVSYLHLYDPQTRQLLDNSLRGPIPEELPPLSVTTISYYRRLQKPVFLTRGEENSLDPHLTHESLVILAGFQDIQKFPNSQQVVKDFQEQLPFYLQSPFPEIRQMAIIASGNNVIGRAADIEEIVAKDQSFLWVLVNHIYERRIPPSALFKYLPNNDPIVFRTIYEMSNNYKDQMIESLIKDETALTLIIEGFKAADDQIKSNCIKIIGNILAEQDDYAHDLMKYNLLEYVYPLLSYKKQEVRKNVCWMLSNYVSETGPSNSVLFNTKLRERLCMMFNNQSSIALRTELYYIMSYLVQFGDKQAVYKMALEEKLLQKCEEDLRVQNQKLCILVLELILKLVLLGEDFAGDEEQDNIFAIKIRTTALKSLVYKKTFSQNDDICNLSREIQDAAKIDEEDDMY